MNSHTRISGKGQVVVPKATRDRLGWPPGTSLDVIEGGDSITLRRSQPATTLPVNEIVARLRELYRHEGQPFPVDQLSWRPEDDELPA